MTIFLTWIAAASVLFNVFLIFMVLSKDPSPHLTRQIDQLKREVAQERSWKEHDRALAEDYKLTAQSLQRQVNTLEHEIEVKQEMLDMISPRRNYY